MADDAGVLKQALDVALAVAGDLWDVEACESGPEVFPLGQDRAPAESGLEAFRAQLLEQALLVGDRETPFGVVVGQELRRSGAPLAAGRPSGP